MLSGGIKLVFIGDGEDADLLKWATALAPRVHLHAISSRGFLPEWNRVVPDARRLALHLPFQTGGWNAALLRSLSRVGAWLKDTDPDWLHVHDLASHGTLAWGVRAGWRLRARLSGSVRDGELLVSRRGWSDRWLTRRVLKACAVVAAGAQPLADGLRQLGAGEVMIVPEGLEAMPRQSAKKEPWLFFADGRLEAAQRPQLVIDAFAHVLPARPMARLVMAGDGPLRPGLETDIAARGLVDKVSLVGRLDAEAVARQLAKATWYFSLPEAATSSLPVLAAMGHACVPILSDLAAHRALAGSAERGLILDEVQPLAEGLERTDVARIGIANRQWVAQYGLFEPGVQRFLTRLRELSS